MRIFSIFTRGIILALVPVQSLNIILIIDTVDTFAFDVKVFLCLLEIS